MKLVFLNLLLPLCFLAGCDSPILNLKNRVPAKPSNQDQGKPSQEFQADFVFSSKNYGAKLNWRQGPTLTGESQFDLEVFDYRSESFLSAQQILEELSLRLWMPHHGHGSRPVEIASVPDSNRVTVSKVFFIMPGYWELQFSLDHEGEDKNEAVLGLDL